MSRDPQSRQSMRAYLAALHDSGELLTVTQPVDTEFGIAACLAEADAGQALYFASPQAGARRTLPVVGNLLNGLPRYAKALQCDVPEIQQRLLAAIDAPLQHRSIDAAPCQQVLVADPSLSDELPIPRFFEHEQGSYITAGLIVARDRVSGQTNLSIARLMPIGGNRAFVGIAPNHHLAVLARAAHARGEMLDIAVCIGNHPAVLLASCLYLGLGDDELPIAGALLGEPLDVTTTAHGLTVPAHCEIVLEGTLDAGEPYTEPAVSEFHGMYENYGDGIVASFSRLTRRHDAIYQAILPGHYREHCLLGGVAIAAGLLRALRPAVSCAREVAVGFGGAGRLRAVVSLSSPRPGEARKAMFAIWAAVNLIKQVVIVDDDIDPWDAEQVEWATATRAKPDRDYLIVPEVRADRSEPLDHDGTITKLGINATRRAGDRDWRMARPPQAAMQSAKALLQNSRDTAAKPPIPVLST